MIKEMTKEEAIEFLKGYLDEDVYTEKCINAHNMAIRALEQQPCENVVSQQAVLDIINERECHEEYCGNHYEGKCSSVCITIALANKVADLPRVIPIRPKGEWEMGYTFPDGAYWKCSVCNELIRVKMPMHFCSNCGVDMRGTQE